MTKKHFIALADSIKEHNRIGEKTGEWLSFGTDHLETLADFCQSQNPRFNREHWLGYIAGTNGPSGGRRKETYGGGVRPVNAEHERLLRVFGVPKDNDLTETVSDDTLD